MKRRLLIRHLEMHGCVFAREGANHTIYQNPVDGKHAPVPRHREIPDTIARTICDELGIPRPIRSILEEEADYGDELS